MPWILFQWQKLMFSRITQIMQKCFCCDGNATIEEYCTTITPGGYTCIICGTNTIVCHGCNFYLINALMLLILAGHEMCESSTLTDWLQPNCTSEDHCIPYSHTVQNGIKIHFYHLLLDYEIYCLCNDFILFYFTSS